MKRLNSGLRSVRFLDYSYSDVSLRSHSTPTVEKNSQNPYHDFRNVRIHKIKKMNGFELGIQDIHHLNP